MTYFTYFERTRTALTTFLYLSPSFMCIWSSSPSPAVSYKAYSSNKQWVCDLLKITTQLFVCFPIFPRYTKHSSQHLCIGAIQPTTHRYGKCAAFSSIQKKISNCGMEEFISKFCSFCSMHSKRCRFWLHILLASLNPRTKIFKVAYYLQYVSLLGSKIKTTLFVVHVHRFLVVDM